MVSIDDYVDREQAYVKHVFIESYLERLVHKTASVFSHIVYVDGYAGPWQSANERFEDTSFGIALAALSRAKASWKALGRDVQMSAFLVERDPVAYEKLSSIPSRYPDLAIRTYNNDFLSVVPTILHDMPSPQDAFAFFLLDPKGWRIPLSTIQPLLARQNSEIIFNFMFDFINRAANIKEPAVVAGLDELIPFGDWRSKLEYADKNGVSTPEQRKAILADAFGLSLKQLGNYEYVAETTVLRPLRDRPLYCLFYATRHPKGIEVFRDCQIAALNEESKTRAITKIKHAAAASGQGEIFESLHDMAPDTLRPFLNLELEKAVASILNLAPVQPQSITYERLRAQVLARHILRAPDVNAIAARLRKEQKLIFPDWEQGKRVPQPRYRTQKP